MTLKGRLPPWAVLGFIGTTGLILVFVPATFELSWYGSIFRDIGIACLTTSILGFTFDRWLKLDIAVDVFRAALGYFLPEEFRGEVRRISNYKFLCEKHVLTVQVDKLDRDTVRATMMLERTIKNISSETLPYKNSLDLDEFGFAIAKSQIYDCQIKNEAGDVHKFATVADKGHYVHAETKEFKVPSGARVFISSKFSEIRRINDHIVLVNRTPTKSPEMEVKISDEFEYECSFGHPDEIIEKSTYTNRHTMVGTYFPNQVMRLRWWPKAPPSARLQGGETDR
jgi:hypothetical protein